MSPEHQGLQMKYFVLKPKGNGAYEKASRMAMRTYARSIRVENAELADDLEAWAADEAMKSVGLADEE